ncbi:glycosyl hydrolase family 8 [Clostridium paraputrificum]|uniref:glycosyl hydrolase family 8 n=2 Tax=Clostridium TaxID=1485 RepID=UPI0018AA44A1|nr:glycosyl hydrolase family 8 [Clostridium paraputrificum]MDB2098442.1 glycosyl hydrolase family 8 [Clostridium paraputrificum]
MRKKNTVVVLIALVVLVGFGMYYFKPYLLPINSGVVWSENVVSEREQILLDFVNDKLTDEKGGIKTNYTEENSDGDITKGSSVLSESEGLMLIYYLHRGSKEDFNRTLQYIKENMILESGVISWRVEGNKPSLTSATIDDLRIIKALLLATEKWKDQSYRRMALNISQGIKKDLLENDLLSDFNDGYNKSKKTTLCYLDLQTIKLLSNLDSDYKDVYKKSLDILEGGYISDSVPLYKKEYTWEDCSYDEGDIDMLLSTIVILNKLDAGEDVSKSVSWIKERMLNDKKLYSTYSVSNGRALSNIESTSIYSNVIQIAAEVGDKELYNSCLSRLQEFQVINPRSDIYGSFGDENTLQVYSFDNLNALIAMRRTVN